MIDCSPSIIRMANPFRMIGGVSSPETKRWSHVSTSRMSLPRPEQPLEDPPWRLLQHRAECAVGEVVFQHLTAQLWKFCRVEIARSPAGNRCVECDNYSAIAGVLRALGEAVRQIVVLRRVELEKGCGLPCGFRNFLKGTVGEC